MVTIVSSITSSLPSGWLANLVSTLVITSCKASLDPEGSTFIHSELFVTSVPLLVLKCKTLTKAVSEKDFTVEFFSFVPFTSIGSMAFKRSGQRSSSPWVFAQKFEMVATICFTSLLWWFMALQNNKFVQVRTSLDKFGQAFAMDLEMVTTICFI